MDAMAIARIGKDILEDMLGPGWNVHEPAFNSPSPSPGSLTLWGPNVRVLHLVLIVQEKVDPKIANAVIASLKPGESRQTTLLVAQSITPAARERLRQARLNHLDSLGNVWVKIETPVISLEKEGKSLPPTRKEQALCSLKGKQAGKVVRRLIASVQSPAVRRLSKDLEVDAGHVSRILTLLESMDLIQRCGHGRVEQVNWEGILQKWASDAPLHQRGKVFPGCTHKGVLELLEELQNAGATPLLTGKDAATRVISNGHSLRPIEPLIPMGLPRTSVTNRLDDELAARMISPSSGHEFGKYWPSNGIYLKEAFDTLKRLGVLAYGDPPDVYFIDPLDEDVFHGAVQVDGLCCAAPYQIAADLLSRPEQASCAEALINWMRANESLWRE